MIELQYKLLGDRPRNEAFFKALQKVIRKGTTTVSDLGSGTGFLSFAARRLGATQCYLYECDDELIQLSKKLARENNITKCNFYTDYSLDIKKPSRTDLVVSETLGNFALEEHLLETMMDAKRFMKPGAILMPEQLTQYVAPVVAPRISKELNMWDTIGFDMTFNVAHQLHQNNMFVYKIGADELMHTEDAAQEWDHINYYKAESSVRTGRSEWKISKETTIYGFALWWKARLAEGIDLSTSPLASATHWDQIYLPLSAPLKAPRGSTVTIQLTSDTRLEAGIELAWEATVASATGEKLAHVAMDTRKGLR